MTGLSSKKSPTKQAGAKNATIARTTKKGEAQSVESKNHNAAQPNVEDGSVSKKAPKMRK